MAAIPLRDPLPDPEDDGGIRLARGIAAGVAMSACAVAFPVAVWGHGPLRWVAGAVLTAGVAWAVVRGRFWEVQRVREAEPRYDLTGEERLFLWRLSEHVPHRFGDTLPPEESLRAMRQCGLIEHTPSGWHITAEGRVALEEAARYAE